MALPQYFDNYPKYMKFAITQKLEPHILIAIRHQVINQDLFNIFLKNQLNICNKNASFNR
jgi:hypothetical protein